MRCGAKEDIPDQNVSRQVMTKRHYTLNTDFTVLCGELQKVCHYITTSLYRRVNSVELVQEQINTKIRRKEEI